MAANDLQRMMQTTLNLLTILQAHDGHTGEDVMAGLMRFAGQLEAARTELAAELRGAQDPQALYTIMNKPNALAMRFGAQDYLTINRRASESFADILGVEGATLTPRARADLSVWLAVAGETLIAVKLLFQTARLYGRAPNGKSLLPDG